MRNFVTYATALVAALAAATVSGSLLAQDQPEPPGSPALATLHRFTGTPDGANPNGAIVADPNGTLYGTTARGGAFDQGTVFQLAPPANPGGAWTETVLYSFTGGSDGGFPYFAALVSGANGALYGSTQYGGASDFGTVFQLTPPVPGSGAVWTETVLHSFSWADGAYPSALVLSGTGVIYGVTAAGGSMERGTVFSLTPPGTPHAAWTESVLTTFNLKDASPSILLLGKSGVLYGVTFGNENKPKVSGTVFEVIPHGAAGGAWTQRILHKFTGGPDGANPQGLAFGENGVLYGTTLRGGTSGNGIVFQLTPPAASGGPWTETVLYTFAGGSDGSAPSASPLLGKNGVLYLTTGGGGGANLGTVCKLTPPAVSGGAWTEAVLYSFTGGLDGGVPLGAPAFGAGGAL